MPLPMAWPPVIHAAALSLSRQTLDYAGGRAISAESGYSVKPAYPLAGRQRSMGW
jgi:hypothetical protein